MSIGYASQTGRAITMHLIIDIYYYTTYYTYIILYAHNHAHLLLLQPSPDDWPQHDTPTMHIYPYYIPLL